MNGGSGMLRELRACSFSSPEWTGLTPLFLLLVQCGPQD